MNAQPRVTTYNKYETLSGENVVGRRDWQNVETGSVSLWPGC